MNTVSLSLSFGAALCLKLKRQSALSVAIESSNQNVALAIAIILLSLEEGYSRDLALNVPVIYMLTNVVFILVFAVTLRRTGWLHIDEEDRTLTLGRIVGQIRSKRAARKKVREHSVEREPEQNNGHRIEMSPDDGAELSARALPLPGQCLIERTFDLEVDLDALRRRCVVRDCSRCHCGVSQHFQLFTIKRADQ